MTHASCPSQLGKESSGGPNRISASNVPCPPVPWAVGSLGSLAGSLAPCQAPNIMTRVIQHCYVHV